MRIGIAVKPGLADARETLVGVEQWLRDHAVDGVWTQEASDLLPAAARAVVTRETLPVDLDLLLVLGGGAGGVLLGRGRTRRRRDQERAARRRTRQSAEAPPDFD